MQRLLSWHLFFSSGMSFPFFPSFPTRSGFAAMVPEDRSLDWDLLVELVFPRVEVEVVCGLPLPFPGLEEALGLKEV